MFPFYKETLVEQIITIFSNYKFKNVCTCIANDGKDNFGIPVSAIPIFLKTTAITLVMYLYFKIWNIILTDQIVEMEYLYRYVLTTSKTL